MQITIVDRDDHLNDELREFARRRLLFALSRFDSRVDQVRAVFSDVNGPRGGVDKLCRIDVKLRRLVDVSVSSQDADLRACVALAADRAGRAVSRVIERNQLIDHRRVAAIPSS